MDYSEFFDSVDKRIVRLAGKDCSYNISVAGKCIKLHFASESDMVSSLPSFSGMVIDSNVLPDAHLSYWTDSDECYIPEGKQNEAGVWQAADASGSIFIVPGLSFRGTDHISKRYYLCNFSSSSSPLFGNAHDMLPLIYMWAKDNDFLLFHGASVGAGGNGAVLSGRGGAGKSTLAIACLMSGMDFIADDYFLARNNADGFFTFPIYRNIGVNPDSKKMLGIDFPVVKEYPERQGKMFMDVSDAMKTEILPIKAIILPKISGLEKPEITPCAAGPAIVRMVYSTAQQMWINNDPKTIARMTECFSRLSAYEMALSKDVYRNAETLKYFLSELKS